MQFEYSHDFGINGQGVRALDLRNLLTRVRNPTTAIFIWIIAMFYIILRGRPDIT